MARAGPSPFRAPALVTADLRVAADTRAPLSGTEDGSNPSSSGVYFRHEGKTAPCRPTVASAGRLWVPDDSRACRSPGGGGSALAGDGRHYGMPTTKHRGAKRSVTCARRRRRSWRSAWTDATRACSKRANSSRKTWRQTNTHTHITVRQLSDAFETAADSPSAIGCGVPEDSKILRHSCQLGSTGPAGTGAAQGQPGHAAGLWAPSALPQKTGAAPTLPLRPHGLRALHSQKKRGMRGSEGSKIKEKGRRVEVAGLVLAPCS